MANPVLLQCLALVISFVQTPMPAAQVIFNAKGYLDLGLPLLDENALSAAWSRAELFLKEIAARLRLQPEVNATSTKFVGSSA